MKVSILDADDRFKEFKKQSDYISQGCIDCIKGRPEEFVNHPFYIFAHKREISLDERISIFNEDLQNTLLDHFYIRKYDDIKNVPTARLIWEPRLTKPKAQANSMLFKSYPPGDNIAVIWMIPAIELWDQYVKGNLVENQIVCESIHKFNNNIKELEKKEDDDLSDEMINAIYTQISMNAKLDKALKKFKQGS